ncbi:MAG: glycosyltransferase like family protein [Anaerocolumna sp.]|jgi:hypothetical protein|nr:glycosyltransferase like family protein [Anaerocolumna sp.]
MNQKKICFISCITDFQLYRESLYYINRLEIPEEFEIECISIENAESMAQGYNKAMKASDAKYKVYMHQDIYICNQSFIKDTIDLFKCSENVAMIGVVGVKTIPHNGKWQEFHEKYGQIYDSHSGSMELIAFNEATSTREKVQAIDGAIMITQYDVPWRDDIFDGWNFYEVSQCLELAKRGYETVIPRQEKPWVIHDCGATNKSNRYEYYRSMFLDEYSETIIKLFADSINAKEQVDDEAIIEWRNYYIEETNDRSIINILDQYLINKYSLKSEHENELFYFDKIKALQILNLNKKEVCNYINNAEICLNNRDFEQASKWCYMAAKYASDNHPGFYTSVELERILIECANNLPSTHEDISVPPKHPKKRNVLHILSEGYSTGGHTRLAKNWMQKDSDSVHSLITTWQLGSTPDWLIDAVAKSEGWTYTLEKITNFTERAAALRNIAYKWADVIVLHIHMFDPIAVMAFGVKGGPPVLFMNHGDHVFWIGSSIIDHLVNFRTVGEELSLRRRNIRTSSILPLPLSLPKQNDQDRYKIRKELGISNEAVVLLTIATPYKFKSFGNIHYIDILKEVLSKNKNAIAIIVGPENSGIWKEANIETKGRILPLGIQTDIEKFYSIADIYVDSYMIGSGTSAYDGGLRKLPVVAMQNYHNKTLSFDEGSFGCDNEAIANKEEYISFINRLIESKELREKEGEKLYKTFWQEHIDNWQLNLFKIYNEVEKQQHEIYYNSFLCDKLGNEDLFLALFQNNEQNMQSKGSNIGEESKEKPLQSITQNEVEYDILKKKLFDYTKKDKFALATLIGEYLITCKEQDGDLLNALAVIYFNEKKVWLTNEYLFKAIECSPDNLQVVLNYFNLNNLEDIETVLNKTYIHNKNKEEYLAHYNRIKNEELFASLFKNQNYVKALIFLKKLVSFKAELFKVTSVKVFCASKKNKYIVIEEEQYRDVWKPRYFGSCEKEEKKQFLSPEIYIAELENVRVIGESAAIIAAEYCLYDMAASDKDNRYDLRFSSFKAIDKNYVILGSENSNQIIEEAISLLGTAAFNYYHAAVELLSRIQYIDSFEEYRSIPLLIDEVILNTPQYADILKILNKFNHPIILIKKNNMHRVKRLVFPSYNTWMPINIREGETLIPEDFLIASSAIKYLRENVLAGKESNVGYRKIFISRKNSSNVRLCNEEDVIDLFKQYGFEVIYPEELSFSEQAEIFSKAEYVAGTSGAAFTNVIYCPQNATIISIAPKKYNFYLYSTISRLLGLECSFLDAKIVYKKKLPSGEYFQMDLNYCNDFLKSLGTNREVSTAHSEIKRVMEELCDKKKVFNQHKSTLEMLDKIIDSISKLESEDLIRISIKKYYEIKNCFTYLLAIIADISSLSDTDQITISLKALHILLEDLYVRIELCK